jgi:aspartate kinase
MNSGQLNIFKFGGASVQNAASMRNVGNIIKSHTQNHLLVVISAIGKTTNAFEKVLEAYKTGKDFLEILDKIKNDHLLIMRDLFPQNHPLFEEVAKNFIALEKNVARPGDFDFVYDQVVSWGEILSSLILAAHLKEEGVNVEWIDARKFIRTDASWREGKIEWDETEKNCQPLLPVLDEKIIVTQGFLGGDEKGNTLTLGRDGSDFSAAIFASCLNASSVTIWKDVPGVMNADPKRLPAAIVFEELPFKEAAEMTYYGASVIHPKTIKPLATKNIPLFVKNFGDPVLPGTKIHECTVFQLPPLIKKISV